MHTRLRFYAKYKCIHTQCGRRTLKRRWRLVESPHSLEANVSIETFILYIISLCIYSIIIITFSQSCKEMNDVSVIEWPCITPVLAQSTNKHCSRYQKGVMMRGVLIETKTSTKRNVILLTVNVPYVCKAMFPVLSILPPQPWSICNTFCILMNNLYIYLHGQTYMYIYYSLLIQLDLTSQNIRMEHGLQIIF